MPVPTPRPPLSPRTWPVWIGVAIGWLAARLPWPVQRRLGAGLGALLYRLMPARRRVAARNIELCLPQLDAAAQRALLRDNFRDLGIGLFEFLRAWWGDVEPMRRQVQFEGLEAIKALHDSGRGLLLVSGHFMNLELCGRLLCDHLPVAGMYRPHDTEAMEWAVLRGRLRYAKAMFTRDELRAAVRHLKQGGVLWYAPDQDMRGKDTVFAPFFGIPAASITATHQLARLTGAAVVPFFHRREGDRYLIRLGAPLEPFPTDDPVADTTRVNQAIEAMVREAPSQYLWLHKRFKRRPEGAGKLY
ncbi:LpxL/LpxP family Kdo(2)-lipid IV(A) lauroyl/palmitoleoyl acyltransferase [Pseudomarimonas salicorniae]|uniref:Lipid A biosynthesis acyltransferase n=1 Tax=Pseudomarimonas salicorniae TaxID=2933270 RepID=A0ABT0GCM8_9GAMM|nr:LpxL/LpxP family Kdo(2)-lipid IV(A) lauroyl/palmitoleoyl acyltransferase [Lysobacter sp. CAU 1642]MCK7592299.1 LpxL/LpxP family Kdo(2)-lipid IV(A) lauroyl/palmitoleoyl acyltransferase [Lysobacter sp. CAU 1642]